MELAVLRHINIFGITEVPPKALARMRQASTAHIPLIRWVVSQTELVSISTHQSRILVRPIFPAFPQPMEAKTSAPIPMDLAPTPSYGQLGKPAG